MKPIPFVAMTALLTAVAVAQVPPGISKDPHSNKALTFGPGGNVPAAGFAHLAFFRLPGDAAGTWTACISCSGLQTQWGGKGGDDVLIGKYNRVTDTFTATTEAAALNGSGADADLAIDERTGRFAVIDRVDGFYFAHRPRPGLAFSAPVIVRGLVSSIIKDFETPALGWVGGKLHLFWAQSFIYMAPLDITNLATPTVPPKSQWIQLTGNGLVEQPIPITGPDGDVEGLLGIHKPGGSDLDVTWMEDLDPTTIDHTVFDTMQFTDGAGLCGSLIIAADRPFDKVARQIQVSWLLGDVEKPGGTVDISGATAKVGANSPITIVLAAAAPNAGIPIPGFNGKFALDFATLLVLGAMAHVLPDEVGKLSFPIPNTFPKLKVALQGVSIDPVAGTSTFTNTAWMEIR